MYVVHGEPRQTLNANLLRTPPVCPICKSPFKLRYVPPTQCLPAGLMGRIYILFFLYSRLKRETINGSPVRSLDYTIEPNERASKNWIFKLIALAKYAFACLLKFEGHFLWCFTYVEGFLYCTGCNQFGLSNGIIFTLF